MRVTCAPATLRAFDARESVIEPSAWHVRNVLRAWDAPSARLDLTLIDLLLNINCHSLPVGYLVMCLHILCGIHLYAVYDGLS